MPNPDLLIITKNEALDDWCGTLEQFDPIALDTEGDSLHCYFEKLCLIQIGLPSKNVLIDPLEPIDFSRFNAILAGRELFYTAATHDLRMLRRGTRFSPGEVFDTYLAARLVGLKEVGLGISGERVFRYRAAKILTKSKLGPATAHPDDD